MDEVLIEKAAALIREARLDKSPLDGLPKECQPNNEQEAYSIQDRVVDGIGRPIGWKVGATSDKAQKLLGIEGPFCGRLTDNCSLISPAEISVGDFTTMCRVEVEYAFRFGQGLSITTLPFSREMVIDSVEALIPAIEIIDSRYTDWTNRGAWHLIADNGVSGQFVMGKEVIDWKSFDLLNDRISILVDDQVVSTGCGEAVLGHPLNSLTWLANSLADRGQSLMAGDVVTTGSCADIIPVEPGQFVLGDFGILGTASISFVD